MLRFFVGGVLTSEKEAPRFENGFVSERLDDRSNAQEVALFQ